MKTFGKKLIFIIIFSGIFNIESNSVDIKNYLTGGLRLSSYYLFASVIYQTIKQNRLLKQIDKLRNCEPKFANDLLTKFNEKYPEKEIKNHDGNLYKLREIVNDIARTELKKSIVSNELNFFKVICGLCFYLVQCNKNLN